MDGSPEACPLGPSSCPLYDEVRRLREECKKLQDLSQTDALTGLFNFRFLMATLEGEMERTRRTGLPTGLIMADIDHFKKVNDTYGHESGNRALEWFSGVVRKTLRRLDVPCRYGGEEFAVILPGTHLSEAVFTAERLRTAVMGSGLQIDGKQVSLTASFGVDAYTGKIPLSAEAFIERADAFLLQAKTEGRNRVCAGGAEGFHGPAGITEKEKEALLPGNRRRK